MHAMGVSNPISVGYSIYGFFYQYYICMSIKFASNNSKLYLYIVTYVSWPGKTYSVISNRFRQDYGFK